jgi:hypothetical protein
MFSGEEHLMTDSPAAIARHLVGLLLLLLLIDQLRLHGFTVAGVAGTGISPPRWGRRKRRCSASERWTWGDNSRSVRGAKGR